MTNPRTAAGRVYPRTDLTDDGITYADITTPGRPADRVEAFICDWFRGMLDGLPKDKKFTALQITKEEADGQIIVTGHADIVDC
jgi:hypothetical protein